jgi:hypothetical protein
VWFPVVTRISAQTTTSTDDPAPTTTPDFRPATCAELAAKETKRADGEAWLYWQNQPGAKWKAYCADLQTAPREYVTLVSGAGKNTATYAAGGASPGSDVVTVYAKVRIDPASFIVDIGDTSFAKTTGSLKDYGATEVTSMPFGVAMTCGGTATANIDFSGTPFHAEDDFPARAAVGSKLTSSAKASADLKSIDLQVTGDCGWIAPKAAPPHPINDTAKSVLALGFVPQ